MVWVTVFYWYKKRRQLLSSVSLSDFLRQDQNSLLEDLRRLNQLKDSPNQNDLEIIKNDTTPLIGTKIRKLKR